MTGPGTNTYLIGIDEVAVLDPGPDDDGHIDAIIGAAGADRVQWVVLPHTHPDHWPAARAVKPSSSTFSAGISCRRRFGTRRTRGSPWLIWSGMPASARVSSGTT